MPVVSAIENSGMSASEEKLPVNGNQFLGGQTASADEPRVFVFVEKNPGDSLGLYLVPFEEEPLTGLFVKTVVPGKSAARLQVFDPGDKIVTVNGKSLNGLTYRESTDFIRQCSGPNVKMGIIKHALYKKEDLERLDSLSVYQRHSGADIDIDLPDASVGGAISLGQASGVDVHPSATRLSGSIPKRDIHGNIHGDGMSKELAIDAPVVIQKTDASFNVESTPDFLFGEGSSSDGFKQEGKFPKLDGDLELSGGARGASTGVDTNANLGGNIGFGLGSGAQMDVTDYTAPAGIFGDVSAPEGPQASGTAEILDSDSSSETRRQKFSKGCRRSRSNPQLRSRQMITGVDRRSPIHSSRPSPSSDHRSVYPFPDLSERDLAVRADYYPPSFTASTAFRASNACAKAAPLVTRLVDSRSFQNSYFVPLSDQPRSDRAWMGNSGMIKSKSLDKLDEIMRNDPILRDDYHSAVPSSKSAQTQTDVVYTKKKPRRKRNDRPRSQILPPTYLQLPSVTWLPDELDGAGSKGLEPPTKGLEAPNDFYWGQNYPRRSHRRKSKEEQAQIVQRWITEMIEHKKAQELLKQGVMPVVTREKSAKLKKKSRSVPEHSFRGNPAKFEHERRASDDSDNLQRKRQRQIYDTKCTDVSSPKLRHSDSDPSVRSALSRRFGDEMAVSVNTTSVGTSTTQTVGISPGASPVVDENISPSLQSRIRSLEQSFKQDNLSASSLHSNNNSLEVTRQLARPIDDSPSSTNGQSNRARVSNPDLPLISHLLSGNELDSQC